MRPELEEFVSKARESLDAAEILLQQKFYDFSASRTYYAMFYMAQAALFTKGHSFSKHSAVIAAFGKHFAKTGTIDAKYHRYLKNAYDKRTVGDYAVGVHVSPEAAREIINCANEFFEVMVNYLKSA